MFIITYYSANANQNNNEQYARENGIAPKTRNSYCWQGLGGKVPSVTAGGNVTWSSLEKTGTELPCGPVTPLPGISPPASIASLQKETSAPVLAPEPCGKLDGLQP